MAKWSELYGISGSKYTKDTVDFLKQTGHKVFYDPTPTTINPLEPKSFSIYDKIDYKKELTKDSGEFISGIADPAIKENQSVMDKWRSSFVQKTPEELATNPVSRFAQGASTDFIAGILDIVRGTGTTLEAGYQKIKEDVTSGRMAKNLMTIPDLRDTSKLKEDWSRFIDKRKESKINATLAPVQQDILMGKVQDSKAAKAGAFVGGAAAYALTAGTTGAVGVAPLFLSSLDNSISTIEAEGKNPKELSAMARAFGTATVEVGSEYMFNVLGGMGSKGAALAARSTVGRSAVSKVTGLFDSMNVKASAQFARFIAKTPNPTLSKYVAFLLKKGNEEGLEELATYIGSGMIQLWTTDKDKKASDIMNIKDAATNYLLGGVMGFAISAVNNVDGLLDLMPKSKQKIDEIKDRPIPSVTTEEMLDVKETIAEEASKPEAQEIINPIVQKSANVAEHFNQIADVEQPIIAEPTRMTAITESEILAKVAQGTHTDSDIDSYLQSPEASDIRALANSPELIVEKIAELSEEINREGWTREKLTKSNLQLLGLRRLADRIQVDPKKGKALSTHIDTIIQTINAIGETEKARFNMERTIKDTMLFHDVLTDAKVQNMAKANMAEDKNYYQNLIATLSADGSIMSPVEQEALYQYYIADLIKISSDKATDADRMRAERVGDILLNKTAELGQSLRYLGVVKKRIPELRAKYELNKINDTLSSNPKVKKARESANEVAVDVNKERKDAVKSVSKRIKKEIEQVEPEGTPFDFLGEEPDFTGSFGDETLAQEQERRQRLTGLNDDTPSEKKPKVLKSIEQRLADRIKRDVKGGEKTVQSDSVTRLLNYLFARYKDTKSLKETLVPVTPDQKFAFVAKIIQDQDLYRQVWTDAQAIVEEQIGEDADISDFLEVLNPLYREKTYKDLMYATLKSMNVSVSDMMNSYFIQGDESISEFSNVLRSKLNEQLVEPMSDADFNFINDQVVSMLKESIQSKKDTIEQAMIRRLVGKETTIDNIKTYQQNMIKKLTRLAVLDNPDTTTMKELWEEALGVKDIKQEHINLVYKTMGDIARMRQQNATEDEIAAKYEEMQNKIAELLSATNYEKVKSYRRLSMLYWPTQMFRNATSNQAQRPLYKIEDSLVRAIETITKTPENLRTTTKVPAAVKPDSDIAKAVEKHGNRERIAIFLRKSAKNNFASSIGYNQPKMSNKLLAKAETSLTKAMNEGVLGDAPVFERHFRAAMATKLYNLGYNENLDSGTKQRLLNESMEFASNIATERTYRALNTMSKWLRDTGRRHVVFDFLVSVENPFITTPIAVGFEGYKFSPLAAVEMTARTFADRYNAKSWKSIDYDTRADLTKRWAQIVAGSGTTFSLGLVLASLGFLTGGLPDDKDERSAWQMEGKQPYSIYIPGKGSFTIDWLQPFAFNLMLAADFVQNGWNPTSVLNASYASLIRASGMENFTSDFGQRDATNIVTGLAGDFFTQGLWTGLRNIANVLDETERDVYGGNAVSDLLNRFLTYAPVGSKTIRPKYDIWGEPLKKGNVSGTKGTMVRLAQAFILPFRWKSESMDDTSKKLIDAYKVTGSGKVLPSVASASFSVDNVPHELNNEQYNEYAKLLGQKNKASAEKIVNSESWKTIQSNWDNMTQEQKDTALNKFNSKYTKNVDEAKKEIIKKYNLNP